MDVRYPSREVGELVAQPSGLESRAPSSTLNECESPSCAGCCFIEVAGVAPNPDEQFSYVDGSSPSVDFVSNNMVSNICSSV